MRFKLILNFLIYILLSFCTPVIAQQSTNVDAIIDMINTLSSYYVVQYDPYTNSIIFDFEAYLIDQGYDISYESNSGGPDIERALNFYNSFIDYHNITPKDITCAWREIADICKIELIEQRNYSSSMAFGYSMGGLIAASGNDCIRMILNDYISHNHYLGSYSDMSYNVGCKEDYLAYSVRTAIRLNPEIGLTSASDVLEHINLFPQDNSSMLNLSEIIDVTTDIIKYNIYNYQLIDDEKRFRSALFQVLETQYEISPLIRNVCAFHIANIATYDEAIHLLNNVSNYNLDPEVRIASLHGLTYIMNLIVIENDVSIERLLPHSLNLPIEMGSAIEIRYCTKLIQILSELPEYRSSIIEYVLTSIDYIMCCDSREISIDIIDQNQRNAPINSLYDFVIENERFIVGEDLIESYINEIEELQTRCDIYDDRITQLIFVLRHIE